MAVLSIDLAYKKYQDFGVVILEQGQDAIRCDPVRLQLTGAPRAEELAGFLSDLCLEKHIRILLLDGPQAWKAKDNGLIHSRVCERKLNAPAKTGEPFVVKPANYSGFVKFSISVYDCLGAHGWERLTGIRTSIGLASLVLVETLPLSAWRVLGLAPLPSKKKCREEDKARSIAQLLKLFALRLSFEPTHDELQAIIAGLAGLAIEQNDWDLCEVAGIPPAFEQGFWREGFIANRNRFAKIPRQAQGHNA